MSIGSVLKKIGKSKITRAIGKGIDFGSDFLPPGFRDVGNLGGKLLEGKNLKMAALGTAGDYVGGRLARGLGSKLQGIGKAGAVAGGATPTNIPKLIGIGPGGIPLFDQTGSIAKQLGAGALQAGATAITGTGGSNPGQDWKSRLLGGVSGLLGGKAGGIGLGDIAKYALPALGAFQASKAAGKADEYRKKGLAGVEAEYAAAKPLRDMGLAGMIDPRMTDVSSLFNQPRPQYRRIG